MQLKRKSLLYFCSAVIILNIIGCGSDSKTSDKTSTNNVKVEQETKVPREHRNALRSAEVYLKTMPFSKKGLYNQLTSDAGEKYPADAAQYAVDNVKTNWKENALKAAKNYDKIMPMSKQGLYEQLTSTVGDGYTPEEAQYAVDHLN